MKRLFLFLAMSLFLLSSCGGGSNSSDLVGSWKEYRADANDDYLLSTWKFNSDGSGVFSVSGFTETQKTSFMWEKLSSSTVKITMNGSTSTLELNNGMLIERSASGTIVFKKH